MAGRRWAMGAGTPSRRMEGGYCRDVPFTDSTYMREVQRRIDSDYKSRLRLRERERMQAEQKREQRAVQPLARPTGPTSQNYDRPWINSMSSSRKMDLTETVGSEVQHSPTYPRTPITGRGSKLPSLCNIIGKKQQVPELAEGPDIMGCVSAGPEHGPTFQAQKAQPRSRKGPSSPQQLLMVPRQSSAGMVRRGQSRGLRYEEGAEEGEKEEEEEEEEEEDGTARAGRQEGSCPEAGLPLPATGSGAESAGQCQDARSPSRQQQTNRILRRLRQERLAGVVLPAAQKDGQEGEEDGAPGPPGAGRGAAAEPPGDWLPFRLRVHPWAVPQRPAGGEGGWPVPRWAPARPEAGSAASSPRRAPPPPPPEASQGPRASSSPPPLLPRLEPGRLVSLLVTAAGSAGPARLQPLSASPTWAPRGTGPARGPPLSMTILALSSLRSQESSEARRPAGWSTGDAGKEARPEPEKPRPDPETLRKLQESLLREDSGEEEEDEGDLCRICLIPGGTPLNPLLEPCKCVGSLQFVHHDCLKKWLQAKIISGADLAAVTTCELCKHTLKLDFDNFDVHEFHRKRAASQVEEQMTSSSLYMAVLLHLYEQRFTELIRLLGGSATTYQFPTAEAPAGVDGPDFPNSDSEEEDGTDLRSRGAIVPDGMLLTFEQGDT
ncbi:nascent polypeptide-associated complex subunit alpha, muscle-specific form-like [Hemiscyllium ocellatum]|uniref:nascent polypeptide-associated complex subunit alpha, muscle-specific form-like n=1 Tax=Hemiscyllium ocellatum TaxID=170820 RepID=UPI00296677EB|nr:nascent polypeptide-associated complex subunit alpha, muscle-specific form-like [Hemiscyllium ocellatum]